MNIGAKTGAAVREQKLKVIVLTADPYNIKSEGGIRYKLFQAKVR